MQLFRNTKLIAKNVMTMSTRFFGLFSMITLVISLTGCSGLSFKKTEPKEAPVSILTGKQQGTSLDELLGEKKAQTGGMPVNALLWRAALDIASFVPLDDVDTFGGSIVTEWYVPEDQPNRRLKLAVFVVGLELRSDAIQVRAYVQNRDGDGWTNAGRDAELGRKLEDLILTRARELRAATVSETSN